MSNNRRTLRALIQRYYKKRKYKSKVKENIYPPGKFFQGAGEMKYFAVNF